MFKSRTNNKGVALIMVLGTFLVVLVLASAILSMVSSQTKLTHHQVSRIQAYYAAMGGINVALEKLKLGIWKVPVGGVCPAGSTCCMPPAGCPYTDSDFPGVIKDQTVTIFIRERQSTSNSQPCYNTPSNACISAKAIYTSNF